MVRFECQLHFCPVLYDFHGPDGSQRVERFLLDDVQDDLLVVAVENAIVRAVEKSAQNI